MNRIFISVALVAVLAFSVHAAYSKPTHQIVAANWTVAQPQSLQSADVHSLVATSFHAIHAGY